MNLCKFTKRYDLVIGNPPFSKLKAKEAEKYLKNNTNKNTTNTFEFFLEKSILLSDYVVMIMPKAILNTAFVIIVLESANCFRQCLPRQCLPF